MHYTKHTISSFIYHAGIVLKNGRDVDAIRNAVNEYGYGEVEIDRGDRLLSELREVAHQQHIAKCDKHENYVRKQALQAKIHKSYMKYVKLARIGFADDVKARKALLLDGARGRVYNLWLFQVSAFCSIMLDNNEGYLSVMGKYGVAKYEIEYLRTQLTELTQLSDKCLESVGEVQSLTAKRQKLIIQMQNYISNFIKVARIALEASPQMLEALGVRVKS